MVFVFRTYSGPSSFFFTIIVTIITIIIIIILSLLHRVLSSLRMAIEFGRVIS